MYVCICNGYRDSEIREAARAGARSACTAYASLGGSARCGKCLEFAQGLIDETHGTRRKSTVSPRRTAPALA